MTPDHERKRIEAAHKAKLLVEWRPLDASKDPRGNGDWRQLTDEPAWRWDLNDYRIHPDDDKWQAPQSAQDTAERDRAVEFIKWLYTTPIEQIERARAIKDFLTSLAQPAERAQKAPPIDLSTLKVGQRCRLRDGVVVRYTGPSGPRGSRYKFDDDLSRDRSGIFGFGARNDITEILPLERRTVPLGPEDWPPFCAVKSLDGSVMRVVKVDGLHVTTESVDSYYGRTFHCKELMDEGWTRTTDNGTTWHPCSKEVEA